MRNIPKLAVCLIALWNFLNSCRDNSPLNCDIVEFPDGGYNYPIGKSESDSGFMFVQVRDSLDRRDSFRYAYMGYHYFKSFNEPNLSSNPAENVTIRVSLDSWGSDPFVLTMTCNAIVIKIADSGSVYPIEDSTRLNNLEQLHYKVLKYWYPVEAANTSPRRRASLDSLLVLYPELLSAVYYRSILEKSLNYDSLPFRYSTHKIDISKEKFEYFIDKINKSGFWKLPHQVSYEPTPTDGGGYIFEVNTPNKYKVVVSTNHPDISANLTSVCQEIIDFAKPKNRKLRL